MSKKKEKIEETEEERLEKEFQKKIEELKKRDPFVYKNF
jgi:hypothetical protein